MTVRRRTPGVLLGLAALAVTAVLLPAAAAQEPAYAPLDAPGPPLSVPADALAASLECTPASLAGVSRNPILLVPGTNLEPHANFDWNYARDLGARGWPYCMVTLPSYGLDDIQIAGEYIVHAIRTMAAGSGREVDVLGYSQGGMVPRWALRWWPDTRALVGDLVGLAPSNHGTIDSDVTCQQPCAPSHRQQAASSMFIAAVNSRAETFAGIDYTVAYTHYDEIVTPNLDESGSSSLRTGDGSIANVALQDVCPTNTADHLAIGSYDAVAHAIAVDALTNDGPADVSRIDGAVCAEPFQPGVDEATFAADYAAMLQVIGESGQSVESTSEEPPLACYVSASCPATAAPAAEPEAADELPATGGRPSVAVAPLLALLSLGVLLALRRRRMDA